MDQWSLEDADVPDPGQEQEEDAEEEQEEDIGDLGNAANWIIVSILWMNEY